MNERLDRAVRPRMTTAIVRVPAWRAHADLRLSASEDELSVEEPLEIRVSGDPLAVTMRTPGRDHELAAGFLLAEGVVRSRAELGTIAHCGRLGEAGYGNAIDVSPAPGVALDVDTLLHARRGTLTSSACGVCGRALIDDLLAQLAPPAPSAPFEPAFIAELPNALRREQRDFERTGGLHAAGVAHPERGVCVVREDVGRHNAVDKVFGRLLLDGTLPASGSVLIVSGRSSFEIVQKALAAGVAGVVSVSAPSSLAVATAARFGLLLCGFARGGRFNVYAGSERLAA